MKKISILLSLMLIFIFTSCFDTGLEEFKIQFVNNNSVGVKNLKFFDDGKIFVAFEGTINSNEESEFKTSPTIITDYLSELSTEIKYNSISIPLIFPVTPKLGTLLPDKIYSVEFDSSFCFKLYEREDESILFRNDSSKVQVGPESCMDESDIPSIPGLPGLPGLPF